MTAGVAYGCATFIDLTISTYSTSYADNYSLTRVFIIFLVVLALAAVLNIFSGHLMAIMNNVSVWWHVVGAAAIVLILIFVPDQHQSFSYVFTERFNNSGFGGRQHRAASASGSSIMPFGFLLTQYTITGFDASAHLSEETGVGVEGGGQGHLALDLLLGRSAATSCCCAWCSRSRTTPTAARTTRWRGGGVRLHLHRGARARTGRRSVLFISASAQFFCATSCMTSASRMTFAFSRDGAIPGLEALVEADRQPGAGQRRDAGRGRARRS